ncbi:hypothetical protein BDW22DRAFT_706973 [Trametopsis cervina]|nr:hypothetical protein BDW22DRAFT_706973 [Trametopsis cervina]
MSAMQTYAPPPGSPPPSTERLQPEAAVALGSTNQLPDTDPPPPYTANPLPPPAWSSTRFVDLTEREHPSDLIRLPLDPPPACFSTPSPRRIRSQSFAAFHIPLRGTRITEGFRLVYAPDDFASHGISAEDWTRFLQDLGIAARISLQGVLPRTDLIGGRAGTAYDAMFKSTAVEAVQDLINVWNVQLWKEERSELV